MPCTIVFASVAISEKTCIVSDIEDTASVPSVPDRENNSLNPEANEEYNPDKQSERSANKFFGKDNNQSIIARTFFA